MSNVTPIVPALIAEPFCAEALGHLLEAQRLLEELIDTGRAEEGSPAWSALYDYLPSAIGMLTVTPDDEEEEPSATPSRLRIV